MSKRTIHGSAALALVAVVGLAVAVGTADAVRSIPVPAAGVRLHADLAAVGSASGSGRFDALLVRTGPGSVRVAKTLPGPNAPPSGVTCPPPTNPPSGKACGPSSGPNPPPGGVICPPPTNPMSGTACVIGGGKGAPPLPVPPVPQSGVHWLLVWRLAHSGVTGPASASIHLGTQGAASPVLSTLCTACQAVATGHMPVTADQAQQLLKADGYVDLQATSGQLSGHIVLVNHFVFSAPVRRARH